MIAWVARLFNWNAPQNEEPGAEESDTDDVTFAEVEVEYAEISNRKWAKLSLDSAKQYLENMDKDSPMYNRVRCAMDKMHVAMCERAVRIFESDIPSKD